ncbi:MAG TPA: hypothetical protein VI434_02535 [Candidatus Dormibacteraeota bacterium]
MISEIREAQFQAAWYYSIIALAMLVMLLTGFGWALVGARRVWRAGDHGAAALIFAATSVGVLVLVGLGVAAFVGLVATGGRG